MNTNIRAAGKDPLTYLSTIGRTSGTEVTRLPDSEFSVRASLIHYDRFCVAVRKIATTHRRWRAIHGPRGLFLCGHTGTGKSSILKFYASKFERFETVEGPVIPVLYIVTPSRPTIRNLAQAILAALGDKIPKRTAQEKTDHVAELLLTCRVELLIIDEFQHFVDSGHLAEAKLAADWLKNLMEETNVAVVVSGLPPSIGILQSNPQLTRRFSAHHELRRFDWKVAEDRREFAGVLKHMQGQLPLPCPSLHSSEIITRMYAASAGVIDYVAKIIDGAVSLAFEHNKRQLGLALFEQAFAEEVWSTVPPKLNPFNPSTEPRYLVGAGEPFWYLRQDLKNIALEG
ncbi:TniB family NTP-binding protein [Burkholderia sp. RF2-non_BP3]|uniref:TniB family NTP-binding protein n=1 Tax=Burkholderia sp. RF2-non_BP3 TaxID=1637844 RepID=UPI000B261046|nr:TniB family NTP-binding protein [Burkholderia sp. RF2-non_BP3]